MSNIEKLIKELCPDGVEYKELKSVFEMRNGYTPSKAKAEFWEGGTIPWFRMEDIRENGNILSDSAQHITRAAVKGKLFPANAIIVATSATIGEHALITVESLANQRFTYLVRRPEYEEKLDPKFVYYYCYKLDEWCLNNTNISSFPSVDMAKFATVYKGNIIKNLIMDCQSYTKYRPNETTCGIFVSWRRKEELPTGA